MKRRPTDRAFLVVGNNGLPRRTAPRLSGRAPGRGLLLGAPEIEDGVLLARLVFAFATHQPPPLSPEFDGRPEGFAHAGITKGVMAGSYGDSATTGRRVAAQGARPVRPQT